MFYDPDDHTPVDDFTEIVNKRFPQERGNINFITADGSKFAHPLRHLGMTKKDLPVLAFDTFKHMHLFKRFSNVYREGILEKFVDDLHTGKLHHNFHHPPADGEEEVYDKNDANQIEGAGADPSAGAAAGDARAAGADGAAAPAAGADGTATTPEGGGEEAKVEVDLDIHPEDHDSDKDGDGKEDTLKDKLEHAEKAKNPDVPEVTTKKVSTSGENRNANEEEHDESHEDMSKPVAVKSILKNLKPSSNRYSFSHNRDEF